MPLIAYLFSLHKLAEKVNHYARWKKHQNY